MENVRTLVNIEDLFGELVKHGIYDKLSSLALFKLELEDYTDPISIVNGEWIRIDDPYVVDIINSGKTQLFSKEDVFNF